MRPEIENSIPDELKRLALLFKRAGFILYTVGGFVRNILLKLPVTDTDICSAMPPCDVIELCKANSLPAVPTGIAFGTVEIHVGDKAFEHTTFRADSYLKGGAHKPSAVRFSNSLFEDAFRRDFSINAIYADIRTGEILDPTGGIGDLNKKLLRTVSKNPAEVLNDDGLRIMRLVRFASELNFEIEGETFKTAESLVNNLKAISAERIRDELNKILLCDIKYGGYCGKKVLRGLLLLRDTGALKLILPEMYLGKGIGQAAEFHCGDVPEHGLRTAAESKPELVLRLAGLLHDVGRASVCLRTGGMYGYDAEGEIISREIMRRLHYDNKTADDVAFLVRHHMYDSGNTAAENTLRAAFVRWGWENSRRLADLREADVHGSKIIKGGAASAERWRKLLKAMRDEGVPFSAEELNCTGADIMKWLNIGAGPKVGEIKNGLLLHCAKFPADNTPIGLRKIAEELKNL